MYLKRHKVSEGNPKQNGWYPVKYHEGDDIILFGEKQFIDGDWILQDDDVLLFWYSEVTERLYTETEMLKSHNAGRENMYQAEFGSHNKAMQYSFEEFISQLNKDKDK